MCPVIRAFLIRINDSAVWSDNLHRTNVLLPLIPRIVGTRNPELLSKRMFFLVNWAVKTIAPLILKELGFKINVVKLESLADIVDCESANAANVAVAAIVAKSNFLTSRGDLTAVRTTFYTVINATYSASNYSASANSVANADWAGDYAAAVINTAVWTADLKEKIVVEVVKVLDQLLDIR